MGTGAFQHVPLFWRIFTTSLACQSKGGGRCEKARKAQAGCCKGCGQWKSCKEGGQEKCQEREEDARQDDKKQEDCSRVLKSQAESFEEHNREACKKLLLIA